MTFTRKQLPPTSLPNHHHQKFILVTYTDIHTYIFTDPSSAPVGLNVEFIMKRAKLQYASISYKIT